jgi:hypothetical protein
MPGTPSLLPKEHGAYAQLAFPLVTGLAMAVPSLSTVTLGAAGVAFFLANEAAAILLGARGVRLKNHEGARARVRGSWLLVVGGLLGALGLATGWPEIWPSVLLPSVAILLLLPLVLMNRQKTLLGEFLVITAFSTLLLPMAAASGVDPMRAALAASVWWLSFGLATLEVRAIKARHKAGGPIGWTRWVPQLASGGVVGGAGFLALGQGGYPELAGPAAALFFPTLATFVLSLFRVHPKHLKRVGWSLVAANSVALVLLLQG